MAMEKLYEIGRHGQYLTMIGDTVRWFGAYAPYGVSYHTLLKVIGSSRGMLDVEVVDMKIKDLKTGKEKPYTFEAGVSMLVPDHCYYVNRDESTQAKMKTAHIDKMVKAFKGGAKIVEMARALTLKQVLLR